MWWKDFFFFSRSQRNGIRILLVLILCMLLLPRFYQWLFPPEPVDIAAFRKQVAAFESSLDSIKQLEDAIRQERRAGDRARERHNAGSADWSTLTLKPFPFDPNKLPQSEWEAMGLPDRLINAIKNYEAAGGQFRFREDLQRIYLMQEEWYAQLEAYIRLPSREEIIPDKKARASNSDAEQEYASADSKSEATADKTERTEKHSVEDTFTPFMIDINRADTSELMQIRGIGPTFAQRIVSYRNILGGFFRYEQLLEVYGLDSNRWEQILPYIQIDSLVIQPINLNQAEFVDFLRHPYINRNLANSLIRLREQHGPFQQLQDIRQSFLICDSVFQKIRPYISID